MASPFLHPSNRPAIDRLVTSISEIEPFEILLKQFEIFDHGDRCTLYLVPECSRDGALEATVHLGLGLLPVFFV